MSNIKRVSPAEAKALLDQGYVYVDVRTEAEYAAGHPAGAHNVPFAIMRGGGMAPNPDFLAVVQALYPKDAKLVLGCQAGNRSMRAAEAMIAVGYTELREQRAGWGGARDPFGGVGEPGWASAGLPTETTTPGGSYAELKAKAGT